VFIHAESDHPLDCNYYEKFDKPLVVQTDENGQISVVVKRLAD
jgi:hypothetical protein